MTHALPVAGTGLDVSGAVHVPTTAVDDDLRVPAGRHLHRQVYRLESASAHLVGWAWTATERINSGAGCGDVHYVFNHLGIGVLYGWSKSELPVGWHHT
jgi:hypothetical protein